MQHNWSWNHANNRAKENICSLSLSLYIGRTKWIGILYMKARWCILPKPAIIIIRKPIKSLTEWFWLTSFFYILLLAISLPLQLETIKTTRHLTRLHSRSSLFSDVEEREKKKEVLAGSRHSISSPTMERVGGAHKPNCHSWPRYIGIRALGFSSFRQPIKEPSTLRVSPNLLPRNSQSI